MEIVTSKALSKNDFEVSPKGTLLMEIEELFEKWKIPPKYAGAFIDYGCTSGGDLKLLERDDFEELVPNAELRKKLKKRIARLKDEQTDSTSNRKSRKKRDASSKKKKQKEETRHDRRRRVPKLRPIATSIDKPPANARDDFGDALFDKVRQRSATTPFSDSSVCLCWSVLCIRDVFVFLSVEWLSALADCNKHRQTGEGKRRL